MSRPIAVISLLLVLAPLAGCFGADTESGTTIEQRSEHGDAPPLNVTHTPSEENYTYFPENETVRYVSGYRHQYDDSDGPPTRIPTYDTVSWERWAEIRGASHAATIVHERLQERLENATNIRAVIHQGGAKPQIQAHYLTHLARNGRELSAPVVPFERVVEETPRAVNVTVRFAGRSYSRTYSVLVETMTMQND